MKKQLKRYFIYGLTIFLPIMLTVYLIILTFNFIDGFLGKAIKPIFINIFGFYFNGTSILIFILLIFSIGFVTTHFLGKKLYPWFEKQLLKLPFFRQVYPAMKEIALFLFSHERPAFKQVVLVEYPRKGAYSLGFLMNDSAKSICQKIGKETCNVLIPTSPSPFSGFVVIIPKDEVILTDMTVEQAVKFFVSDGVVNPE
ncbi:MAG: DUF502 domain-containing protein [Candidatus Omnitrophota bacterium]